MDQMSNNLNEDEIMKYVRGYDIYTVFTLIKLRHYFFQS